MSALDSSRVRFLGTTVADEYQDTLALARVVIEIV